jgi:hypothetical protein
VDEEIRQDDGTAVDKLAIGLSLLCLVHCLALPIVVLAAPALEAAVLGTESPVHWVLLALALPVSCYALWHGFRHHGHRNVLVFGAAGLALMLFGVSHLSDRALEMPLTVIGVLLLLVAHVINLRQTTHCTHAN